MPVDYKGVQDMAPQGMGSRLVGILDDLSDSNRAPRDHVARIIVLTGRSTLHYLDQIVGMYRTRAHWDIRVLIMDPESPEIPYLDDGAREEILSSLKFLEAIDRKASLKTPPVQISWRAYARLPMIRAFLLDEDHMFFGYFAWEKDGGSWKLHEQNKRFIYAKQGDDLSSDSIAFFKGWFDREWSIGRELDEVS